ncbi:Zinc finger, MYND-type [Phytophthora cactorum]|nr:Zinc finger, MYND-type [Phytophthora cactorum]
MDAMTDNKAYDQVCEEASTAAEMRLLEHFKQHGGEVWSIGTGCQSCRQKLEDVSGLKRCSNCDAALFCGRECQLKAWPQHKADASFTAGDCCTQVLTVGSLQTCVTARDTDIFFQSKMADEPKTAGVASSIGMNGPELPGWFFTVDVEAASKERQKALYQAALELYGLLKDDDCWYGNYRAVFRVVRAKIAAVSRTRDKESFPRSSYTLVESLPHASPTAGQLQKEFVEMNGHLLLFSAWLQHPEPPATQSMPFEDRSFFGVVDSLLQISALRDGVDAFMDARS